MVTSNTSTSDIDAHCSPMPERDIEALSLGPTSLHVTAPYSELDFLPLLLAFAPFAGPAIAVHSVLSELSRIAMTQLSGTPPRREQPNAPRSEAVQLPELDAPQAGASASTPIVIDENTNLSSLTPAQLYELNQRSLDESTSSNLPLIAAVAPIKVLREEYENGSQAFVRQIDSLQAQGYHGIRRTRGDGDCFYRSLAFAYIERIMGSSDPALEATMAISTLDAALPLLESVGFDKFAYEDFYEELTGLLKRIESGTSNQLTPETLLSAFQAPEVSTAIVVFLRLLTSAQIRVDPESFDAFLFHPDFGTQMTARDFCESFVEPTGKEADHVQMTALARALKVNVKVAYLDGHSLDGNVDFVSFESALDPATAPVVLLYRPGHYDILDTRSLEAISLE